MSSQRINLYQSHLRPRRELLSARNLALMVLVLALLLIPPTWWIKRDLARTQANLQALLLEEQEANVQLAELAVKFPAKGPDLATENKLQQLANQREMAEKALGLLKETREKHLTGFSPLLTGFAQAKQQGVWLTRIGIRDGGNTLSLKGECLQSAMIPLFVDALKSQPVFAGREFRFLDVKKNAQDHITFALKSLAPDKDEAEEEEEGATPAPVPAPDKKADDPMKLLTPPGGKEKKS